MCDQHDPHSTPSEEAEAPPRRRNPAMWVIHGIVGVYRLTLAHIMGGHCRFVPSCSQYMLDAVDKYGAVRGFLKGIGRILRCHPFTKGGYDPA